MTLFERPSSNYLVPDFIPEAISKDEASPLQAISLLIPDGSTVLDIGCGNGMLARVLKQMGKKITIDGVEPNSVAVSAAKPFYSQVYQGTTDSLDLDYTKYSHIALADVIEHMVDPESFFLSVLPKLNPETVIFISIPNVAFGAVRIALLNGKFDYVDSGLLEKTHLRFFTREFALQLFQKLGLFCAHEIHLCRDFWKTEIDLSRFKRVPLIKDEMADPYQFLFALKKKKNEANAQPEARGFRNSLLHQLKMRTLRKAMTAFRK